MTRELRLFIAVVTFAALLGLTAPATACTSFCFNTPEGPVFGANLDLRWGDGLIFVNRRGLAKTGYMLNTEGQPLRWVARYGSVSFNLVGIEMPWSGMNEAGLVVSGMQLLVTSYPAADERYPVSSATWTQYMLDTCATVDEVIDRLDAIRLRGDPVHFLVADATGACVIVEYLAGETLFFAGEALPVRALANATYRDCMRFLEHGVMPAINPGHSAQRVAAAAHWTGQFDPEGDIAAPDWALGVLTEAVVDPRTWWKRLFSGPYTQWSIAYDIARREIRFTTVDHAAVRSLSFTNLDFDCAAEQLMLDVNAELSGPIASSLQPYDPERNHAYAHRFLDRWGVELADDQVRELVAHLESFACAPDVGD